MTLRIVYQSPRVLVYSSQDFKKIQQLFLNDLKNDALVSRRFSGQRYSGSEFRICFFSFSEAGWLTNARKPSLPYNFQALKDSYLS